MFRKHVEHDGCSRYRQDGEGQDVFTSDYGPETLDISPDSKTIIVVNDTVGSINRSVNFIDVASGRVSEKRVIGESSNLRDVVYTPDGQYVVVTYEESEELVTGVRGGERRGIYEQYSGDGDKGRWQGSKAAAGRAQQL